MFNQIFMYSVVLTEQILAKIVDCMCIKSAKRPAWENAHHNFSTEIQKKLLT